MGMVNYYGKFIPKLSTVATPINQLREKEVKWKWTKREEKLFEQLKQQLDSNGWYISKEKGQNASFDCTANGVLQPVIVWIKMDNFY